MENVNILPEIKTESPVVQPDIEVEEKSLNNIDSISNNDNYLEQKCISIIPTHADMVSAPSAENAAKACCYPTQSNNLPEDTARKTAGISTNNTTITMPNNPSWLGRQPKLNAKSKSGYILFSSEVRKRIISENPEASFGEVSKLVGIEWKRLPEEQKRLYDRRAESIVEERSKAEEIRKSLKPGQVRVFCCRWELCNFQFDSAVGLYEHVKGSHIHQEDLEFGCLWTSCLKYRVGIGKPFPACSRLLRHIREKHLPSASASKIILATNRTINYFVYLTHTSATTLTSGGTKPGGLFVHQPRGKHFPFTMPCSIATPNATGQVDQSVATHQQPQIPNNFPSTSTLSSQPFSIQTSSLVSPINEITTSIDAVLARNTYQPLCQNHQPIALTNHLQVQPTLIQQQTSQVAGHMNRLLPSGKDMAAHVQLLDLLGQCLADNRPFPKVAEDQRFFDFLDSLIALVESRKNDGLTNSARDLLAPTLRPRQVPEARQEAGFSQVKMEIEESDCYGEEVQSEIASLSSISAEFNFPQGKRLQALESRSHESAQQPSTSQETTIKMENINDVQLPMSPNNIGSTMIENSRQHNQGSAIRGISMSNLNNEESNPVRAAPHCFIPLVSHQQIQKKSLRNNVSTKRKRTLLNSKIRTALAYAIIPKMVVNASSNSSDHPKDSKIEMQSLNNIVPNISHDNGSI